MALAQEDIEQIQLLISRSIAATPEVGNANVRYELELRDRTTKVEEELKHQRDILINGFAQMDKRFEQMKIDSDRRFDQVDKRFEQMKIDSDKRFEQVDKRFEKIDLKLEKQTQAIMDIHQEIKLQMRWSFGVLVAVGGLVLGILRLTG